MVIRFRIEEKHYRAMLTSEEILNRVRAIIAKQHGMQVEEITPDTHLYLDLDDSLDAVEVYIDCEEAFGVEIEDADIEIWDLTTARHIAAFIENRLRARA